MFGKDIVVARYNEDVSWIYKLDGSDRVVIYNKGESPLRHDHPRPGLRVLDLPNIGRESHTYLFHICQNYHGMCPDDVTVFCQAGLRDHVSNITTFMRNTPRDAFESGFSERLAHEPKIPLAHQAGYNFRILEWPRFNKLVPNRSDETYGRWFERCLRVPFPRPVKWIPGACFAVKNSNILANPLEFYRQLLDELEGRSPEAGHFFERSWKYVFDDQSNAHRRQQQLQRP